jgi:hypothetical protein
LTIRNTVRASVFAAAMACYGAQHDEPPEPIPIRRTIAIRKLAKGVDAVHRITPRMYDRVGYAGRYLGLIVDINGPMATVADAEREYEVLLSTIHVMGEG